MRATAGQTPLGRYPRRLLSSAKPGRHIGEEASLRADKEPPATARAPWQRAFWAELAPRPRSDFAWRRPRHSTAQATRSLRCKPVGRPFDRLVVLSLCRGLSRRRGDRTGG